MASRGWSGVDASKLLLPAHGQHYGSNKYAPVEFPERTRTREGPSAHTQP